MLKLRRQGQMDKAKATLRDLASYVHEVIRDEQLRADLAQAVGHGAEARDRLREDIDAGGIVTRLAADKRLRRKLRETLADLDDASDRLRRKRRHRVRNVLLLVAGAGAIATVIPKVRLWLDQRGADPTEAMPVT